MLWEVSRGNGSPRGGAMGAAGTLRRRKPLWGSKAGPAEATGPWEGGYKKAMVTQNQRRHESKAPTQQYKEPRQR